MRCLKCGTEIASRSQEHDCAGVRKRLARGVSSEVERMKEKNLKAIREVSQRGGPPPPDTGGGSYVE